MNVFKELVLSVYDFKSYQEFLRNKASKVFLAGLILMGFYFLVTMVVPFLNIQIKSGGFVKVINENVPDFEIKNGTLWVEKPFEYEDSDTYVLIDSDSESFFNDVGEIENYITDYNQVLLMDSEKLILKNKGEVQSLYFDQIDLDFSKDSLLGFVPYAYLFVFLFMLAAFIFMTGTFFFGVLFVALLGMIAASCMKYQLTFGQLYLLAIYARTLPILIKAIASFLPFSIPMFLFINFGLSVLYIVLAIQKMRDQELKAPLEFTSDPNNYYINN